MKIINDIVPVGYQKHILEIMTNSHFPWFYNQGTSEQNTEGVITNEYTQDVKQFTHRFCTFNDTTPWFHIVTPIIVALEEKTGIRYLHRIMRIKANMIMQHQSYPLNFYNLPHTDVVPGDVESETLLYYVNNSDGDTIIFNERDGLVSLTEKYRVTPQMGKAILFDSHIMHASSPPIVNKERVVINFVFKKD